MRENNFTLRTLNNPGWILKVDLRGTPWEGMNYEYRDISDDTHRTAPFYDFRIKDCELFVAGDSFKLGLFFSDFRKICEKNDEGAFIEHPSPFKGSPDDLDWIMGWYAKYSDRYWAKMYVVTLKSQEDLSWDLSIPFEETFLEGSLYESGIIKAPSGEWFEISMRDNMFIGKCDARSLPVLFAEFKRLCLELGEDLVPLPLGPGGYDDS